MCNQTYQLLLVLDGQGGVGHDGGQIDLVLLLEASLVKGSLPLVRKGVVGVVLLQHRHLLARLLHRLETCLELLLVLLGVLAADENLHRHLATFEWLKVGSYSH